MPLRKELGLISLTLAGIGVILGAGIYTLIGKAAGVAGEHIWVSFTVAGFVALMTGLTYAELSARFPKAGAEYVYTRAAFPKEVAFITGFALVIAAIASTATVALGFGGYFLRLLGMDAMLGTLIILAGSALLIGFGTRISAGVAGVMSLIEIGGLVFIIGIGLPRLGNGFSIPNWTHFTPVLSAAALVFFAYLGFEELVRLTEEAKNGRKIMPIALLLSIGISTLLYILVAASTVGIVGSETLAQSSAPLADVAAHVLGENAFLLIAVVALFATGNTVLLLLLAASRLVYGMARERALPAVLGKTHHQQPRAALIASTIAVALLTFIGDITYVAHLTDGLLFLVFAIVNLSLILIRLQPGDRTPGFRVPLNVGNIPIPSVLGLGTSLVLLTYVDRDALAGGVLLLALIAAIYFLFLRKTVAGSSN